MPTTWMSSARRSGMPLSSTGVLGMLVASWLTTCTSSAGVETGFEDGHPLLGELGAAQAGSRSSVFPLNMEPQIASSQPLGRAAAGVLEEHVLEALPTGRFPALAGWHENSNFAGGGMRTRSMRHMSEGVPTHP